MPAPTNISTPLIDTHCHLDFPDFNDDRDQVINSSTKIGISHIVVPGVTEATWSRTIEICNRYPVCRCALGMHPVFIDEHQPQHLTELDQAVDQHHPVAIGEIGLDYFIKDLDREKQQIFFTKQLIIANRHRLPVIIHNRKAHDDCIALLREHAVPGGIIHAFNGSLQQAEKYMEMNFLLGFGGMLTYERSTRLRGLASRLPLDKLVLETDAPDMTVARHRGQRNSPAYLRDVLETLAEIRKETVEEVAVATTANAVRLLKLDLE